MLAKLACEKQSTTSEHMNGFSKEANDDFEDDLRADDRHKRRYMNKLNAHPDCRDPDHPGCGKCRDDGDDE